MLCCLGGRYVLGGRHCHSLSTYYTPGGVFSRDSTELNEAKLWPGRREGREQNWAVVPPSGTGRGAGRQHRPRLYLQPAAGSLQRGVRLCSPVTAAGASFSPLQWDAGQLRGSRRLPDRLSFL